MKLIFSFVFVIKTIKKIIISSFLLIFYQKSAVLIK